MTRIITLAFSTFSYKLLVSQSYTLTTMFTVMQSHSSNVSVPELHRPTYILGYCPHNPYSHRPTSPQYSPSTHESKLRSSHIPSLFSPIALLLFLTPRHLLYTPSRHNRYDHNYLRSRSPQYSSGNILLNSNA